MSRFSLRYYAGYGLVLSSRLFRSILAKLLRVASLPERCSLIVWTPQEIDRYARAYWDSRSSEHLRWDDWIGVTEKTLVETYFKNDGEILNMACGAGREALLLDRKSVV